jgi:tetratricopeptide (TPR) repeat protein
LKDTEAVPSVTRRDLPPGGAMKMTPGLARILLAHLIEELMKRRVVEGSGSPNSFYEPGPVKVTADSLSYDLYHVTEKSKWNFRTNLVFKQLDYVSCAPVQIGFGINPPRQKEAFKLYARGMGLGFAWKSERSALRFSDAFNRLVYEAHFGSPDGLPAFGAAAKAWRERPESRPQPPDGWESHRVLAEQSIREKKFIDALVHYEAGLQAFPTWPEGWFNAALLYAELGEYVYAADRMRRYLELVPDAPDAKAAREKIIIWDEKAK